jgi:cell division transport system permease protein
MRRSPYQALLAIVMMSLSFFVTTNFLGVLYVANRAISYIETRPQVIAYFEVKATDEQIQKVKDEMAGKSYVAGTKFVSKDEALKIFKAENQKDPLLTELVTADILPASVEVSAKSVNDLETISDDLKKLSGVEEVVYQKDIIQNLSRWTKTLRQSAIVVTTALFSITLLLVVVILSLRVAVKRKEIGIMNLLGASRWYIRAPFLIEGILYGVMGAIFGWLGGFIVLLYATPAIVGFFGSIPVLPIPPLYLALSIGAEIIVGFILGLVSSFVAVARFIKQ